MKSEATASSQPIWDGPDKSVVIGQAKEVNGRLVAVFDNPSPEASDPEKFNQAALQELDFPVVEQEPGLEALEPGTLPEPPPLVAVEPDPEPEMSALSFPGVAWLLVLNLYFTKLNTDPAYAWAKRPTNVGGLQRNMTRKPDSRGNMWEVRPSIGEIILTKTPQESKLRAAQVVIDHVMNSASKALRDYFTWRDRLPRRVEEGAEPQTIKEARIELDAAREALEALRARYEEAAGILDNAVRMEYHWPLQALEGFIEYDVPLSVVPIPINPKPTQPLAWPDLDTGVFEPERGILMEAVRTGAIR